MNEKLASPMLSSSIDSVSFSSSSSSSSSSSKISGLIRKLDRSYHRMTEEINAREQCTQEWQGVLFSAGNEQELFSGRVHSSSSFSGVEVGQKVLGPSFDLLKEQMATISDREIHSAIYGLERCHHLNESAFLKSFDFADKETDKVSKILTSRVKLDRKAFDSCMRKSSNVRFAEAESSLHRRFTGLKSKLSRLLKRVNAKGKVNVANQSLFESSLYRKMIESLEEKLNEYKLAQVRILRSAEFRDKLIDCFRRLGESICKKGDNYIMSRAHFSERLRRMRASKAKFAMDQHKKSVRCLDDIHKTLFQHLEELSAEVVKKSMQVEELEMSLRRLVLSEQNDLDELVSRFSVSTSLSMADSNRDACNLKLGTRVKELCAFAGLDAKQSEKLLLQIITSVH